MKRPLDFSKQINSAEDIKRFSIIFSMLKNDYGIEEMKTTLLVYDILKRRASYMLKNGLAADPLDWEEWGNIDHE